MEALYEAELKELETLVGRLERGELSRPDFRAASVHYGVYTQRQPDQYFVRLRVPCGEISAEKLEALGKAVEQHAQGACHLTTRQGFEVHNVKLQKILPLLRELAGVELLSHETGGNSVRAIMVCSHAGAGAEEVFDVTGYAQLLTRCFVRHPAFQALPRKIKIGFSCCADDCARSSIQDLGFQARINEEGRKGFRVLLGGGTGALPRMAQELVSFLPVEELTPFTQAFLAMFNRLGNRTNRARARVKFLVQELGLDELRATIQEERSKLECTRYPSVDSLSVDSMVSEAPATTENSTGAENTGDYWQWLASHTRPQKQNGLILVSVKPARGTVRTEQLLALARAAWKFGIAVRLTPDQGFLLRSVPKQALPALYDLLRTVTLADPGKVESVVACPGSSCCSNAFTNAAGLARELAKRLQADTALREVTENLTIRTSGCANGCAMHAIADIGLEGLAKRNGDDWRPAYRLWAGGVEGENAPQFGEHLGIFEAQKVPEAVAGLLRAYSSEHFAKETLRGYVERLGPEALGVRLQRKCGNGDRVAGPSVDWGDNAPYQPRLAKAAGAC